MTDLEVMRDDYRRLSYPGWPSMNIPTVSFGDRAQSAFGSAAFSLPVSEAPS